MALCSTALLTLSCSTTAPASTVVMLHSQSAQFLTVGSTVIRISSNQSLKMQSFAPLAVTPRLQTQWRQISPTSIEAIVTGVPQPGTRYDVAVPTSLTCLTGCQATVSHVLINAQASITDVNFQLAQLGYLPLNVSGPQNAPTFTWRFPHLPADITALWNPSTFNPIERGAVMTFQDQHKIPATGVVNSTTYLLLRHAVATNQRDPKPWDYVDVATTLPETETLFVNGVKTFSTKVNTGISLSPTALGTYPVYLRYLSQTMSGTNPDGTHYSDPGIPWVSYFNGGDALHGFIRASYGWPQSLGCVEQTFNDAKYIFPYTPIGTLVTVR
jgi:peptidoglycan hydrolase-like protein with peptidoglycan-binding domain